ncbi:Dna2/Cas4 domain-containing protein, partial [Planktothrix sp.]|uniref:Dna2/Cas4 domain-containing protein n=1 Tax=Planktothrix sp. TaxID=3088171 RepID=UPI0038D48712
HQRQLVEISSILREQVINIIDQVFNLFETGCQPLASYQKRCQGCSLYESCLPKIAAKVSRYQEVIV